MAKKVLFIGHYREHSGWGQAARDYILALQSVGVDVVCRPLVFMNDAAIPDEISKLENKSTIGSNVCIQNVLPHYMTYENKCKNIGLFFTESFNWYKYTSWGQKVSLMDELWVPTKDTFEELPEDVKAKTYHIPCAFNISDYTKRYEPLHLQIPKGKYIFYFIGEYNRRKNISGLLKAFHSAFNPSDQVELVLKLNSHRFSAQELTQEIENTSVAIQRGLGKWKQSHYYKQNNLITSNLSRLDMLRLHASCHCFVSASFGEGWGIPTFEAYAMGNSVIQNSTPGPREFLKGAGTELTPATRTNIFGADRQFEDFGTCREEWNDPVIKALAYTMRSALKIGPKKYKRDISEFSYENVGNKMKERIYA